MPNPSFSLHQTLVLKLAIDLDRSCGLRGSLKLLRVNPCLARVSVPAKAAKVTVAERQPDLLEERIATGTAFVRVIQRAKVGAGAFEKQSNEHIVEVVDLTHPDVGVWRKRWKAVWQRPIQVECSETQMGLKRGIEKPFADPPRSGWAPTFTPEQQSAFVTLACEDVGGESERPVWHLSHREFADEVVKRNVGPSLSGSRGGAFLKSGQCSAASSVADPAEDPHI